MAKPFDPDVIKQIRHLIAEGMTRNEIARTLGVSPAAVTKYAPPGSFDRSATIAATRAVQADHARKRSEVNARLLVELDAAIDRFRDPVTVRIAAGKEVQEFIDRLPGPRDLRDLATAVGQLAAAHARLAEVDERFGERERSKEAVSVLDGFMQAVARRANELGADDA